MSDKPRYTVNQQKALTAAGNAAVSASAGSGKTTVMIAKILRDLETTDIDNILILTYNNSIAAEMRSKIISALFEAVKSADSDAKRSRYAAQIDKIQFADISTIHGFCNRLVKANFEALGIDPTYDILTDDELSARALKEVMDEYYASDDDVFTRLTELLLSKPSDDYLDKTVLRIYRQLEIQPRPEETLKKLKQIHTEGSAKAAVETVFGYYAALFADFEKMLLKLSDDVALFDDGKYLAAVRSVVADAHVLACSKNFAEMVSFADDMAEKTIRLPSKSEAPAELKEKVKAIKSSFGLCVREITSATLAEKYDFCTADEFVRDNGSELKLKLLEMVERYAERYSLLKRKEGKLDYGDLEHFAIKLLDDADRLAAVTDKYKLVFVDEYQDVNASQEYIIDKVASGARVFTVGDVKQSIYGFRSANPEIFSERLGRYACGNGGEAVYFNDNFRCNYEILDYVNRIFDSAMTVSSGSVDYKNTARFVTETADGQKLREGGTVRTVLFHKESGKQDEWKVSGIFSLENYVENDNAEVCAAKAEAQAICQKIKSLVGKRIEGDPKGKICDYGDISVLVRSRSAGKEILAALKANGFPVSAAKFEGEGYTAERDEIINLLRVLDNVRQDIPLAGYLLGYFGGFTRAELADVRLYGKSKCFFDNLNLTSQSDTELGKKVRRAFEIIDENRKRAASSDLFEFLNSYIATSGFEAYVLGKSDGADRLAALRKFVYSLKGQNKAKSAHAFVKYWDNRTETGANDASAVEDGKSIVMQSMHGSKGLEYPIVFVANLGVGYVFDKGNVGIDEKLGLGINVFDDESRTVKPSILSHAISIAQKSRQRSEEMRLLYVALTRAKYQLYVSGSGNVTSDRRFKSIFRASSMLDVINYASVFDEGLASTLEVRSAEPQLSVPQTQPVVVFGKSDTIYNKIISEIINHKYKYAAQTKAEQKYSVTALNKTEEQTDAPVFFGEDDRRGVGIAYHTVMENVDFSVKDEAALAEQIDNMVKEGILDAETAAMIDLSEIMACVQNAELRKILGLDGTQNKSPQIFTELPFTLLVDADKVLDKPGYSDKILVQGVIDLLVMGDENVIVDYKNSLKSPEKLAETYKKQLYLYKMAVETSFGEKVDKIALYSFPKKTLYYL